jgi:phosphatidylethanolamine/phosphatidyl-N-methylethanolamine N-methyltransferase
MAKTTTIRAGNQRFRNARVFLRAWGRDPLRVGAIASSSVGLAGLITAEITPASMPVLELGPGTGVFTRALLARGIPENRLTLVECDPGFARILQLQFPASRVLNLDAARLGSADLFDREGAGAVISGLPLLSMSGRRVMAILDASFRHMRPGAAFFQFTYGPRCPVRRSILDRLGLKASRMGFTLANMPPAAVYRIHRRRPRLSLEASDGIGRQAARLSQ